jgi:hypothetical protein
MTNDTLTDRSPEQNQIILQSGDVIIRVAPEGFFYRGTLVEDAGEAHRLFVEFLRQARPETAWRHADE